MYAIVRVKNGECLGVFSSYEKAQHCIQAFLQTHGDAVENVMGSDSEGWQQTETRNGEFLINWLCALDVEML